MEDKFAQVGPREQQIIELLLQGCDNSEIARQLKMARRTVKAHFNRLFMRFAITGGIKRVKLAMSPRPAPGCPLDRSPTAPHTG